MATTNTSSTFPQKVRSQGRIVIPLLVRSGLKIKDGDNIIVTVQKTKEVK
jgi:AbrB family looped-hinge helix DNA binding protein